MPDRHQFPNADGQPDNRSRKASLATTALQCKVTKLRIALANATTRPSPQTWLASEPDRGPKIPSNDGRAGGLAQRSQVPCKTATSALAARIDQTADLRDVLQSPANDEIVDLSALLQRTRLSLDTIICDEPSQIELQLDAGQITAPAAFALPVVMIVSELVLNSLLHAFPAGRPGKIRISAAALDTTLLVVVADDGVALPEPVNGSGFDMNLVHAMADQIGGTLIAEYDRGARFSLVAPLSKS